MKKITNRVTALFAAVTMLGSIACFSAGAEESSEQYHDNVTINGIDMYEKDSYFGENDNNTTVYAYWQSTVRKTDDTTTTIGYGGPGEKYNDSSLSKKFNGSSVTFNIVNKEQDYIKGDYTKVLKTNFIRLESKNGHDLSDIKDNGYVRFWMYVDTLGSEAAEASAEHKFKLSSNNGTNAIDFSMGAAELNTWVKKEIKLSELLGSHSGEGIKWFMITPDTTLTEDYKISFQNIGFYYPEVLKETDHHELKYTIFGNNRVKGNFIMQSATWGYDIKIDGEKYSDCLDSERTVVGGKSLRFIYPGKNTDVAFGGKYWEIKLMQKDWMTDGKFINNIQDISGYNDPYLQFLVYTDLKDLSQLPKILIGSDKNAIGATDTNYGASYQFLTTGFGTNVVSGKWCNVKIRLSDLYAQNETFDKSALMYFRFVAPSTINETYNIYIQNLCLYDAQTVKFDTLEQRNNKVALSWTASNADAAASYKVYENNTVYETTQTSMLIDVQSYDVINNYKVEALDADGNVISESETKALAIYKLGLKAESANVIYGSDGVLKDVSGMFYMGKWSEPGTAVTDAVTAVGGKSWTFKNYKGTYTDNGVEKMANNLQIKFDTVPRNVNEDMYLEFLIYPDTDKFESGNVGVWSTGAAHNEWPEIKAGQWNLVRVKLSDMGCKGTLEAKAMQLAMPTIEDKSQYDVYIQNLRYVSDGTLVLKDGNEITSANGGEVIDIAASAQGAKLIVAEYKADALKSVKICDGLSTSYTIGTDCDSVKAFAWDFDTLKPLAGTKTITVTQTAAAE